MSHNLGTWHNCFQMKLTSEESCQRKNCKTKYKLESQNPLGEQSCQCHVGTIVPVSLGNNSTSFTWEQSCKSYLGTIVPASHGNNCASVTWEQSCQSHLKTIVPALLGNNRIRFTWGNCASLT